MSATRDSASLGECFERIVASGLFDGSHVSLERDHQGETTVNVVPHWIEAPALRFLVNLASELELSLALTKDGLRLDEQTGDTVRGVQAVKDVLRAGRDGADDED
jgi:hypothetical protein